MCEYCHQSPCHPRCPNYVPEKVYTCTMCDEPIDEGEEYVDIDGDPCHFDCVDDLTTKELLGFLDVDIKIAEKDEEDE